MFGKIGAHWCANAYGTVNFKRIYGVEVSHFLRIYLRRLGSLFGLTKAVYIPSSIYFASRTTKYPFFSFIKTKIFSNILCLVDNISVIITTLIYTVVSY